MEFIIKMQEKEVEKYYKCPKCNKLFKRSEMIKLHGTDWLAMCDCLQDDDMESDIDEIFVPLMELNLKEYCANLL